MSHSCDLGLKHMLPPPVEYLTVGKGAQWNPHGIYSFLYFFFLLVGWPKGATSNTTQLDLPAAEEQDSADCNYVLSSVPPSLSAVSV